jgi:hypothetical protein
MKIEIKNWLGVVILLCLGFVLGKVTVLPDVNANPQKSEVGRYQLAVGEIEITSWVLEGLEEGEDTGSMTNRYKTFLRIDTMTGDVDLYQHELVVPTEKDTLVRLDSPIMIIPEWKSLTSVKKELLLKYRDYLEGMKRRKRN